MSRVGIVAYCLQSIIILLLILIVYRLIKEIAFIKKNMSNQDENKEEFGPIVGSFFPSILNHTQNTNFRGEYPNVILFFAVGCPPCESLIESLESHRSFLKEYNFLVFLDDKNSDEISKYIVKFERLNLPTIRSKEFLMENNIKLFPFYVILDNVGKVINKGPINNLTKLKNDLKSTKRKRSRILSNA
ncbi:TlpA family protein disulfide reductase [Bacillus cereus]|uniref:TlpA family protein disulfide reductase n=1 Tax=Bacillus cereus TaxID=1396 RepID=UPI003D05359C